MRSANFVEETTTSIAGTSGDGAITLTAIASTPRFSTVFGTQATTIRYVIEDTVGKRFETGIGSVASNVLTRTRPQVTWDGTTYDDSTPAPIAFGSTPTSGNIKVRLSATAESQGANVQGLNRTIAGDDNTLRDYRPSAHVVENTGTGGVKTAGVIHYTAFLLPHAGLLDGALINVSTAVASTSIKWALYDVGPGGVPVNRLALFNDVSSATTGNKVDTATGTWSPAGPVWLTPGWYAVAFISDGAIGVLSNSGTPLAMSQTPFGRQNTYGFTDTIRVTSSFAAGLPTVADMTGATLGTAQTATTSRAQIRLRVTP